AVFFFQAEDGIRDFHVTGVQTCALPICYRLMRALVLLQMADNALLAVVRQVGRDAGWQSTAAVSAGGCRLCIRASGSFSVSRFCIVCFCRRRYGFGLSVLSPGWQRAGAKAEPQQGSAEPAGQVH